MNDDKLSLLHRYLDGAITPEELGQLENLLAIPPLREPRCVRWRQSTRSGSNSWPMTR